MVEEKDVSQTRPEQIYSEMLLRQHSWLKDKLEEGEHPAAVSYRKPDSLRGLSLGFIGLFLIADTALHVTDYGGIWPGAAILLAGAALLYSGVWFLCFAKKSYILVTSERVLYQPVNWMGKPGKARSIPRGEIRNVRLLKSTVMYRAGRSDGDIFIETRDGGTVIAPNIRDGENILGVLR